VTRGWQDAGVQPSDLPVPDSAAATAALDVCRTFHTPAMLNHCVRSYLWSAALATTEGTPFDAELLYVAAMLHDLGLIEPFDSHTVEFGHAGGGVGWVFAAGAGWPPERRERVREVIVAHMADGVDPAEDPEGSLLGRGTAIDIAGIGVDLLPASLPAEVLARWPRLTLAAEFGACFRDQAARKPDGAAGRALRSGLVDRMAANPLGG
jgi:HD domain